MTDGNIELFFFTGGPLDGEILAVKDAEFEYRDVENILGSSDVPGMFPSVTFIIPHKLVHIYENRNKMTYVFRETVKLPF